MAGAVTLLRRMEFTRTGLLSCPSCGERQARKGPERDDGGYSWRCRRCGKGWAYRPLAPGAVSGLTRVHAAPPPSIERDADWESAA